MHPQQFPLEKSKESSFDSVVPPAESWGENPIYINYLYSSSRINRSVDR